MLLIGSIGVMWAWWGKQFHEPKCGSGHVCRVMAWTRQQGLVPYIGFENVRRDISVCSSLCGPQKNLVFYSSPFLKSGQFKSFFNFLPRRLVENLLWILFFVINSINVLPCAKPMSRDTFFFFFFVISKISRPWQHPVSALLSC